MLQGSILPLTTLKARLSIGAAVLLAISVALVGIVGVKAARFSENENRALLVSERLIRLQQKLFEGIQTVNSDARILANTPPIQGLIRASRNGGFDPADGYSSEEIWRKRLEEIFSSFHKLRPNYVQIRFVGLEDGREIVRVDKRDGMVLVVEQSELQDKSSEPYFEIGANLSRGQYHLQSPTWNRENGVIQEPRLAVSRMLLPVFDENGERFGFLVINYDTMQQSYNIIKEFGPGGDVIIHNSVGGTFLYDLKENSAVFYLDGEDVLPPDVSNVMRTDSSDPIVAHSGRETIAVRTLGVDRPVDKQILLALVVHDTAGGALIGKLSLTVAVFGTIMMILGTMVTRSFIGRQLAPFLAMRDEFQRARKEADRPRLPVDLKDEVGEVAREFDALTSDMELREKRMEFLFSGVRDGICIIGSDGRIEKANPGLEAMLGYDSGELVGLDVGVMMPERTRLNHKKVLENYFTTGLATRIGLTTVEAALCKDGSEIDIELSVDKIDFGQGCYFAAVIRDVSARTRAETEREALIEALRLSNEELDSFAYVASHDLKAPLRAIETASRWLLEDLEDTLDADSKETLSLMRNRVFRMGRLLDGLLEHSRIGRKTGDTESPILSGAELASDICGLLDIPEAFSIRFSEPFQSLKFQQMPLRTVLLNLVSNVIKHHDRPDGSVDIDAREENGWFKFSVKDDGPGIDPKFHDRVFRLFQTLQSRDRVEGSGLGLAICRKQVRLMGGDITLTSENPGEGCLFEFTWPSVVVEENNHAA